MRLQIGALALALIVSPAGAAGFKIVTQVSNQPGVAPVTDADLVNPWGLAQVSDSAPLWVNDNGTDKVTLYNRTTGAKQGLVVSIPGGAPTGQVAVPSGSGFAIGGQDPLFLFDSEAAIISGWSSGTAAAVAVNETLQGAVYKGLAIDPASKQLYAADFVNNHVEIFDNTFHKIKQFTDKTLPARFAPFNVLVANGKLYVAFARREPGGRDEIDKPGFGYVDVYSTAGVFQQHLIPGGLLNAPWGLAIAPSAFGTLGGALLVGNFGDGSINAYNASTGSFIATLAHANGQPLQINGLWALDPGPGTANVQFSAGPNHETNGRIGLIQPN